LKEVAPLLGAGLIKGMAHITGGGITENLPRTLPDGLGFTLDRQSWSIPPLFAWLQRAGGVSDAEMFRAFNMGVGLVLVCAPASVPGVLAGLGPGAWELGRVG
jgi:phosphoribosylformylglycinamidine cyclo-ligase